MKLERIIHCRRSLWGLGWLVLIAKDYQDHAVHYWLPFSTTKKRNQIRGACPSHQAGDFKKGGQKILWVLGLRRYPTIHNEERVEVRTRLGATYSQ